MFSIFLPLFARFPFPAPIPETKLTIPAKKKYFLRIGRGDFLLFSCWRNSTHIWRTERGLWRKIAGKEGCGGVTDKTRASDEERDTDNTQKSRQ